MHHTLRVVARIMIGLLLRKAFGSRSSEVDRHGSTIQLRSADQCRSQGPRSPQQKFVLTRINYVTDYINNTTKQRELGFRTRTAFPMGKRLIFRSEERRGGKE